MAEASYPDPLIALLTSEISNRLGVPQIAVRGIVKSMLEDLAAKGYGFLSPGEVRGARPPRENVPLTHASVFCPHCGKHNPPFLFRGNSGDIPGFGFIEYLTVACGECRAILPINVLKLSLKATYPDA